MTFVNLVFAVKDPYGDGGGSPSPFFPKIFNLAFPDYKPGKINLADPDLTLGRIISVLLPYIFAVAGLTLFGFLIFGGFQLLTSGGNPETVKKAQGKITSALVGFLIIFLAYWLTQILEVIFGISIFG